MAIMKNLWLKLIIFWIYLSFAATEVTDVYVSTTEESNTNAIEGFGTDLQCLVSTCLATPNQKVKWYKSGIAISDGLTSLRDRISIRHNVILDPNKDCTGKCTTRQACPANHYCLEPSCCQCNGEEFTLVITNLSLSDNGIYKCMLEPDNKSVEIRLNVMEGGTFPTFNQNLTFDHSKCCEDQRMSAECLPMCKPSILETHKFDPVPCQKEFSKLLNCATIGGNVSHIHCCRLSFVPPFCWEFCSGRTTNFQKSNRLCVYWMPEIFQCYEQAYLPYPGPPEQLVVNPVNSTSLEVCWDEPKIRGDSVRFYSVRYQEVPRFPFFGGAIPFLTGDGDGPTDSEVTETPVDEEIPPLRPLILPTSSPSRPDKAIFGGRKKRQALIISTHNFATNETEIREFKYLETNTSETCETLVSLKPSTQYFVYVTATNNFGTSLPSLRQTAVTEAAVYPNNTLPNVKECCLRNVVDMKCVSKMCDVENPPTAAGAFNLAFDCRKEFGKVAPCLADGRDHSECCREKNVGGECLKLCDGSANQLGMTSVLCLSLDIQSIYSCYREGYIHLPSPPTNLTVPRTSSTSADVSWDPPTTNNEKILSYSLFFKISYAEEFIEVENARSPFTLVSLQPDSTYNVYVVARSAQGSSLKSTVVRFFTSDKEFENICRFGKPLKDSFDQAVICGARVPCPTLFKCVDSETDDSDKMFCCPTEAFVSTTDPYLTPNLTSCCSKNGVPQECLKLCSYNVTVDDLMLMGPNCHSHLKTFVDCGGDGRNDRPCCLKAGIPEGSNCLDFCEPPLEEIKSEYITCAVHAERIIKCGLEGVLTLPGQPIDLHVEDSGSSFVTLAWNSPSQTVTVLNYEVRLFGSKRNFPISLNTTGLSLTIPDLLPNEQYVAHVIAWNGHGSSMPGKNVTFMLSKRGIAVNPDDDFKPRPPTKVERQWYKQGSANISWIWINSSVTGKVIERYSFRVAYKTHIADKQPSPPFEQVNTTKKFVILTNLSPGMAYDIQVYAVNTLKNIESISSEMINIVAQETKIAPSAEFITDPRTNFKAGDRVSIICKGSGDPEPYLTMEKGGKFLANGTGTIAYVFKKIKPEDGLEPILCTVDNGGIPFRHRTVLKVRYAPIVSSYANHVTAIQDLSTKLVCRVQGYPKPQIDWYFISDDSYKKSRSPYKITESSNRVINVDGTDIENVLNATLKLTGTQPNDAGYYYCKAENELGAANGSFYLIVEPFPVPKGPDYVHICCQQQNVLPECLSACTNEINLQQYENPQCFGEIPKLYFCARDGIDNRRCCSLSGVPEICLPNCNGVFVGGDNIDAQHCSNYRSQIVSCVQDGHSLVSGPPEEFNISVLDSGKVNVTWKPPSVNNEAIQMYVMYYKKKAEQNYTEVRTPSTYVLLNGLEPETLYNFTVISVNHYGFSTFVPIIEKVISLSDDGGRYRGIPKFLSGTSSNVAGTVLGVIFCLLLAAVIILAIVYFTRRPYKLPAFILKLRSRASTHTSSPVDSVAFENPGYDREGQVRGLPGDGSTLNGYAVAPSNGDVGWEHPRLETPDDSPAPEQRGMRYTQLT